jgi:hypothetical protein
MVNRLEGHWMSSPTVPTNPIATTDLWAARIAGHASLADERLNTRLAVLLSTLAAKPSDSLPQACGDSSQAQAAYRFFANQRIEPDDLLQPVVDATSDACRGLSTLLAVQDSSSLNFSSLATTTGLGPLNDSPRARGLHMHTTLAVRDDGVTLGILDQQYWIRPVQGRSAGERRDRPIEDKESYKWLLGVEAAEAAWDSLPLKARPRLIHVMDREGDVHEVLQRISNSPHYAIIRCGQNRSVAGAVDKAFAASAAAPVLATVNSEVPQASHGQATARKPRRVLLSLRRVQLTISPDPRKYPGRQALTWTLIDACEENPAPGCEALHWRLWTNLPIHTLDDVLQAMRYYSWRWRVEDFHLTFKSGCRVEKLELEDAQRLIKAAILYAAVAVRIVALRDWARVDPHTPCTAVLTADEWQPLWLRFSKEKLTAQTAPPTIEQVVRWIGRLGGHLGRKRDGLPGVRTLWRGFRDLSILATGFRIGRTQR